VEVPEPVVDLLGLGELGQGAALVGQLVQSDVDRLEVEKAELGCG
jgi:hypothetical protein